MVRFSFSLLAVPWAYVVSYDISVSSLVSRLSDVSSFAEEIRSSELAQISPEFDSDSAERHRRGTQGRNDGNDLPLVFLHGMGDSCFNSGMKSITQESGEYLGVYSVCIPTGDTRSEDTINGFLMSMNENVDVFAEKVRADPLLSKGFNCIGLSQGNNICRGYIQRYNDPPVSTHLSIHGPVVGVAALPHCYPDGSHGTLCQEVSDILGKMAYNAPVQNILFQADYYRDVNYVNTEEYKTYSQMGDWNNEDFTPNSEINSNFAKTSTFAMIKANADSVVVPREGEWFGAFDEDYETILTMKETSWYKNDLFGLRTADEAGKIFFNSTEGNHLEFTDEELYGWLDLYC